MSAPSPDDREPAPPPAASKPRVWLITSALSPLGYAAAAAALKQGDSVAAGCTRSEIGLEQAAGDASRLVALKELGQERVAVVELDVRNIALCQSSLAEAAFAFRRIDVLLICSSASYVGALEELSPVAVLAQFEAAYFGPVNMMRAALPLFRRQRYGHLMTVTGTTGAMGTPGLSARAAADHATEGLSDALAFEVAPFGTRVTIVQPGIEAAVLCVPVFVAPENEAYTVEDNPTAAFRRVVEGVVGKEGEQGPALTRLAESEETLAETVAVLMAIGGLENPPGRVVVGEESVEQIKERLKTVSEELEEYLEASTAADIVQGEEGSGKEGIGVDEDMV